MLNKEALTEWRDALLKYPQTNGRLRKADGFCCLGVACDVSGLGEWDGLRYILPGDSVTHILPDAILAYYGIENRRDSVAVSAKNTIAIIGVDRFEHIADFLYRKQMTALTVLNDAGVTFEEIARIITLEFGLDD
jgi:hypothetical protein